MNKIIYCKEGMMLVLCAVTLAGCGGGGGGSSSNTPPNNPPSATAEGYYRGAASGSEDVQLVVLENGDIWGLKGPTTTSNFSPDGFFQGTGTSNNGTFAAPNTRIYPSNPDPNHPAIDAPLTATFNATAKTINVSLPTDSGPANFNAGPNPGSAYDYNTPATLSTIAGSSTLNTNTDETIAITLASTGSFTAISNTGCTSSGTILPRPSGKNVFNVTLNFGAAPCVQANQTATGIALAYPLAAGGQQILAAFLDSTRTHGMTIYGTR